MKKKRADMSMSELLQDSIDKDRKRKEKNRAAMRETLDRIRMQRDERMTACQNCGAERKAYELKQAKRLHERVDAGEETPAGECPDCGALCHVVEVPDASK